MPAEEIISPDQTKRAHANRLEIRVPGRKSVSSSQPRGLHPAWPRIPGCNLEGSAEDLRSYEFRHVEELSFLTARAISWTEVEGCRGERGLLGEWKDRRPLVVEDRWAMA